MTNYTQIHYILSDGGYQLTAPYQYYTGIRGNSIHVKPKKGYGYVKLSSNGILEVGPGYWWDGPSGPALDTVNFLRASLIHDVLYDLIGRRALHKKYRKTADRILREVAKTDGMPLWRRTYAYVAVRLFGWMHV